MKKRTTVCILIFLFAAAGFFGSCTFDYGDLEPSEQTLPDLVMGNVEYVRVRSADPVAKFEAKYAERYEKLGKMNLEKFLFEQYGDHGNEVNVLGTAGYASIDIQSGDIFMEKGVRIEVDSEDIIIVTNQLDWKDESRLLSTGEDNEVNIYQKTGTDFTGMGLRADTRRRTWEFSGSVIGNYIFEDEEEENTKEIDENE